MLVAALFLISSVSSLVPHLSKSDENEPRFRHQLHIPLTLLLQCEIYINHIEMSIISFRQVITRNKKDNCGLINMA